MTKILKREETAANKPFGKMAGLGKIESLHIFLSPILFSLAFLLF